MAPIIRCWRTDPGGSSAALVAAWLIDAMVGLEGVRLHSAALGTVELGVSEPRLLPTTRDALGRALAEPRFAGWQLLD
jgi:hypothetical protein